MSPGKPSTFSLRRSLQATSLLAVLAGYAVLLITSEALSNQARLARYRVGLEQVRDVVERGVSDNSPAAVQEKLDRIVAPSRILWVELAGGQPYQPPEAIEPEQLPLPLAPFLAAVQHGGDGRSADNPSPVVLKLGNRSYLSGSFALQSSPTGARLRVLLDVTGDLERGRRLQLLLLVVAGLSSLFTSALLRLVMNRGLLPLDRLSQHVAGLDVEHLDQQRLPLAAQPQELRPIVSAFNGLLDRLAQGRERERRFVDGVAHELRTPITLISGYAQSLRRHGDAAESPARNSVLRIEAEAQRMGRLVADLLDMAREDAGQLELRSSPFDADEALLEAFERLAPLVGSRLRLHPPAHDTAEATGDPERLQQCLTNLVENALKYSPAHQPVELFRTCSNTQVLMHVRDHGPGVPEADRQRIFQRFERGAAPAATSGSGIGLALVKLLMERMGGDVAVQAAPGGGADFRLLLPRSG